MGSPEPGLKSRSQPGTKKIRILFLNSIEDTPSIEFVAHLSKKCTPPPVFKGFPNDDRPRSMQYGHDNDVCVFKAEKGIKVSDWS